MLSRPWRQSSGRQWPRSRPEKGPAGDILRIAAAGAVLAGVLKPAWNDGYKGIVDLRGIIAEGDLFEHIRNPDNFKKVQVERYGHSIYWGEEGEEQAALVMQAS